ncbi:MAG: hypothetical protein GC182_16580 [Rhodopseudomonas sp.]|nr:hypothetical protein [Rhodopseudomonas sp.]
MRDGLTIRTLDVAAKPVETMKTPLAGLLCASLVLCSPVFVGMTGLLTAPAFGQSTGSPQVAGATPIGKILKITGTVSLEHKRAVVLQASLPPGGSGRARVDDPVFEGDVIKTAADSTANIAFADGTSFNVSQNAEMTLDEFVYSPNGKSNSTVYNLTKGAFTFIAGEVAHTGSMKVETPLATMGIRGTAPHVEIREDGSVKFLTLIEENKKKPLPVPTPIGVQKAQAPATPSSGPDKTSLDGHWKICRNC